MRDIIQSIQTLEKFHRQHDLKREITVLQTKVQNKKRVDVDYFLTTGEIDTSLLEAALTLKGIVGQINVIIHAWGVLLSLPNILQPDEIIEYVSLGAGNTGKKFDLKTSRRVAEFKFIDWKGGPETIRKNNLFKDFYTLAEWEEDCEKNLYVLGIDQSIKALNTQRTLKSTLPKRSSWDSFSKKYGNRYRTVQDYYQDHKDSVTIVDLRLIVPELSKVE